MPKFTFICTVRRELLSVLYKKCKNLIIFIFLICKFLLGEITLVALGPLTNIALAMKLNKNFERNVKNLIVMGGNKDGIGNVTASAEFNFYSDPEAANVVFKRLQGLEEVKATIVTWELCRDSYLPWVKTNKQKKIIIICYFASKFDLNANHIKKLAFFR
jgi:inosine-uridine nucleoside N-ribohydrolase